jgi:glutathione S-transferase
MSLVFHYTPMTSAVRIHWLLEELGVPYEKKKVDLAKGEQRSPEYLALNPNGKVPLIVDDGTPIFESLAILIYLGEKHGVDKGLYPPMGPKRGEALRWLAWGNVTLGDAVSRLLRNTSERFPADEQNAKAAESAKKEIGDLLKIVDDALDGTPYLLGDTFTIVDLAIGGYLPFLARLGIDLGPFKRAQEWLGRCTSRPGLAKAMQG